MKASHSILQVGIGMGLATAVGLTTPVRAAQTAADAATIIAPAAANRESLRFRNGDLLYGALESITSENGIRWRHEDVEGPVDFFTERVAEIRFRVPRRALPYSTNACRVQLTNKDELEGDLLLL